MNKTRNAFNELSIDMKPLWIIFALALTVQVHAQKFMVDTLALNTAYRDVTANPNTPQRQEAYFNAFPKNWEEYIDLYKYSNEKGYDLAMYRLAADQMNAFAHRLTLIKKPRYCNRLLDLAKGAMYGADAPAYLRGELHRTMTHDMEVMIEELSKRSPDEVTSFWDFYWAQGKKNKQFGLELLRLNNIFRDDYPEVVASMMDAWDRCTAHTH